MVQSSNTQYIPSWEESTEQTPPTLLHEAKSHWNRAVTIKAGVTAQDDIDAGDLIGGPITGTNEYQKYKRDQLGVAALNGATSITLKVNAKGFAPGDEIEIGSSAGPHTIDTINYTTKVATFTPVLVGNQAINSEVKVTNGLEVCVGINEVSLNVGTETKTDGSRAGVRGTYILSAVDEMLNDYALADLGATKIEAFDVLKL